MKVSHLIAAILVVVLVNGLFAQVVLTSDPVASTGYGVKNCVRNAAGDLYCLVIQEQANGDRPLLLQVSTDGGTSWSPVGFTFNDASSGLNPPQATNVCAMTIDDQGVLHATWATYYYYTPTTPDKYRQWYRNYDPATMLGSTIVDINAVTGASTTSRTAAMDIRVDGNNLVWIVAHGTSSWVEKLIHSDLPYAAGLTFTDVGNISMSSSSSNSRICIDANGNVHCSYYRNIGPGEYWHRIYVPGTGWQASTNIGNGSTAPHDYLGVLEADSLGNVHSIAAIDTGSGGTWKFRYKAWDAANLWGPETVLFDVTPAQYTGIANYRIFDIAVDAGTGKAYVVYRDLSTGGQLTLVEKDMTASAFSPIQDLTVASTGPHQYYLPALRGTLYPASNRLDSTIQAVDLDIMWQFRPTPGTPPYQQLFQRVSQGPPGASITLGAAPAIGTLLPVQISSPNDPSKLFICGFAAGDTPGIVLGDARVIPLNLDPLLDFSLLPGNGIFTNNINTLDGNGDATALVLIPNAPFIVGLSIYGAFVIPDSMASAGVGTISQGLTITFQ